MTATEYLDRLSGGFAQVEATDVEGDLPLDEGMDEFVNRMLKTGDTNGIVYLLGNGGSAAVAAHAQNDLIKGCSIKALVLQDVPTLTAASNDCGYDQSLSLSLRVFAQPSDLVIAISSSGASKNILRAADVAKEAGAGLITCTGFKSDNPLRKRGALNFYVPSEDYGHVELTHAALLHCLTDRLKANA